MFAVTAEQMRTLDSNTISLGVASSLLMENAARAILNEILKHSPSSVLIFCGKGQNAGDGFAVARQLFCRGIDVKIILVVAPNSIISDAKSNYNAAKNLGIPILIYDKNVFYSCDILVDALLGTGLTGVVEGAFADAIKSINQSRAYIISADIPSGISSDTGKVCGHAVKANKTVTFGFHKTGLYSPLSVDYTGEIIMDEISIPRNILGTQEINTFIINPCDIQIPKISKASHKGTNGHVLIAGGKKGMTGAVYLAALAASKSGAGLVTCAVPHDSMPYLMKRLTVAMCADIEDVDFSSYDTVVFGNGIGTDEKAAYQLNRALCETKKTLIIDADGINLLADDLSMLKKCHAQIILTPHPLEFKRLTGKSLALLIEDRIKYSKQFASENNVTLVFKGAYSVVTFPDKSAYINITGNEGMAKGGSGDVLAGMIGGIANHCVSAQKAAISGVYLHGLAGDIAEENIGTVSMTADDIITYIPEAFKII